MYIGGTWSWRYEQTVTSTTLIIAPSAVQRLMLSDTLHSWHLKTNETVEKQYLIAISKQCSCTTGGITYLAQYYLLYNVLFTLFRPSLAHYISRGKDSTCKSLFLCCEEGSEEPILLQTSGCITVNPAMEGDTHGRNFLIDPPVKLHGSFFYVF